MKANVDPKRLKTQSELERVTVSAYGFSVHQRGGGFALGPRVTHALQSDPRALRVQHIRIARKRQTEPQSIVPLACAANADLESVSRENRRVFSEIRAAMAAALLAAGVALAALNPALVRAAPGGDTIVEETTGLLNPHFSVAADIATCPAEHRAVGGGLIVLPGGLFRPTLRVSSPVNEAGLGQSPNDGDIARGWYAFVDTSPIFDIDHSFSQSQLTRYRIVALCSATSDATVVAATFTARPTLRGAAVAKCPDGARAVGGGVRSMGENAFTILLTSGPVDESGTFEFTEIGDVARGWHASVLNVATFKQTYNVFALCSKASDAIVEACSNETGLTTCPSGRRVVGGGIGVAFGDEIGDAVVVKKIVTAT